MAKEPSAAVSTILREMLKSVRRTRLTNARGSFWRWKDVIRGERTDLCSLMCSVCTVSG